MDNLDTDYIKKAMKENNFKYKLFKTTTTDVSILLQLFSSESGENIASIFQEHEIETGSNSPGVSNRSNMKKVLDKLERYQLVIRNGDKDENLIYNITKRGKRYLKSLELINKSKLDSSEPYKGKPKNINVEYYAGGKRIRQFKTKEEFQAHYDEARHIAYGENYYVIKHENRSPDMETIEELNNQSIDDVSVLINNK